MMNDFRIGVVSTYPELSLYIQQLADELKINLDIREGILEEGVKQAYQLEREGVDVIIGRGVTGRMIKKVISLPMVLIDITSFDILTALHAAQKMGKRIAFLGHRTQDITPDFESITEILGIKVDCYPYGNEYEMNQQVSKILKDDTDVVVSTGLCIYEMARRSGVNAVLVQSSYGAIYSSIKRAQELIRSIHLDQQRSERFRSVLELTNDGILILNEHKQISFMNPSAEKLLGIDADKVLGRSAGELRNSSLLSPLLAGSKSSEAFKEVGQKQFLVNSMPIHIKNKEQGQVITFQSADRIQVLEHNLRRQLFKKGLVARHNFADLIGNSPLLKDAIRSAKKFAAASATVLICGESGTGKELFAQSIHNESKRRKGPFVAVNCAALPENLLESELFGYEEGAFTGAKKGGKSGLFEMAHGGTIFLDEIGEMTLPVQARLLRILQEREIMRLGSDRVIPVDVRIIAATNYDLSQEVRNGKFRRDLYHRLEVLNLDIPPLKARKEDIGLLAGYFVKQFSVREKKPVPDLNRASVEKMERYDWPGNVRELQNLIQKYVLLIEEGQSCDEVIERLISEKIKKSYSALGGDAGEDTISLKIGSLEEMEREVIDHLQSAGYSTKEISRILGTSRTTLWRRAKSQ